MNSITERKLPTLCLLAACVPAAILLSMLRYHTQAWAMTAFDGILLVSLFIPTTHEFGAPDQIQLSGLSWVLEDFRRHWLCVGKSGCGKTIAFVKTLLIQITLKIPNWGGVAIDDKGDFHHLLTRVFKALKKSHKLIVFRVRRPGRPDDPASTHTINFIGNRKVPWSTWAQLVVDVAVSQGQKTSNAHFKNQAYLRICDAFETLDCVGLPVTLVNGYDFLVFQEQQREVLAMLAQIQSERALRLCATWSEFFSIAGEEQGSIRTTAQNYLAPYATPEIAEVFCSATPTTEFRTVDDGFVLCASVPQVFLRQRRYVNAFMKILLYMHGQQRFDEGEDYIEKANDLVLLNDEAHRSLFSSEEGVSDINSLDILRAAHVTCILTMQDYSSAIPPIGGKERADVLFTNTNNHVIFGLNSPTGREIAAKIIDKHEEREFTYSTDRTGRHSASHKTQQKFYIEPSEFKHLRTFDCVIQHCEGEWTKTALPPLTDDGRHVERWYWYKRLSLF